MKVSEVMSGECKWCRPDAKVSEAAQMMAQHDFGSLPIAQDDKLVGMITDRDLVVRGLAKGRDLKNATVQDLITKQVYYCYEDQSCDEVADNMAEMRVRRLPVVTRDKRLVGIVSLGDLARKAQSPVAETALKGVSSRM